MARSLEQIQQEMLTAKQNEFHLAGLQSDATVTNIFQKFWNYVFGSNRSTSKVAIWRLWIYITSFCIWTLEVLFDEHSKDVDNKLLTLKPHGFAWYQQRALDFQFGFDLKNGSVEFENTGKTDEEIALSKIVKSAAVSEIVTDKEARLYIKIATEKNGILSPLSQQQYSAFKRYMKEIKDWTAKVRIINYLPDRLKLNIRIVRDPLVLNENGEYIQGGASPVNEVIKNYMKKLPFNGELSLQKLEREILAIDGVNDLKIDSAKTQWIDEETISYGVWKNIDIATIPFSGYFAVNFTTDDDTKSVISYV